MVETAVEVAAFHNIRGHPSIPNMAKGNCAFESCIDQINVSRGGEFTGAGMFPDHKALRYKVVFDLASNAMAKTKFGYKTEDLNNLLVDGHWDSAVGDLVVPGIAYTTKKNILIFHTNPTLGNSPISVVLASEFGGESDTEVR